MKKPQFSDFILPKLKYAATSVVATSVDYLIFFVFVNTTSKKYVVLAQIFAYSCGLLTNFFLQKKYIFDLKRPVFTTFQLSVSFSVIGLGISTLLIYLLHQLTFFNQHLLLAKILITGVLFFYNFYTKRFAFEGKPMIKKSPSK